MKYIKLKSGGVRIRAADILRSLGEPTRLRILNILLKGEACVCDLEMVLGATQSNVSRHLGKLRDNDMLTHRKQAQWVYYNIDPRFSEEHKDLLAYLKRQLQVNPECQKDLERLQQLAPTKPC